MNQLEMTLGANASTAKIDHFGSASIEKIEEKNFDVP